MHRGTSQIAPIQKQGFAGGVAAEEFLQIYKFLLIFKQIISRKVQVFKRVAILKSTENL